MERLNMSNLLELNSLSPEMAKFLNAAVIGELNILISGGTGSGKTTTAGKLARMLVKAGKKPMLVAGDIYRPAAVDQLTTLGRSRPCHPAKSFRRYLLQLLAEQQVAAAGVLGEGFGSRVGCAGVNGQYTGAKGLQPEAQGQPVGGVLQADRKSATDRRLELGPLRQAPDNMITVGLAVGGVVDVKQRCSHGNLS